MTFLTDDQQDLCPKPTKANIVLAMQWLVMDARPNDTLFPLFWAWRTDEGSERRRRRWI
ncbi:hypothetical protein BC826DRAFT_1004961 [Russula brevipes]|nr:hypothetical protein BC826DRAFT_1004961 [Russula brevipes]